METDTCRRCSKEKTIDNFRLHGKYRDHICKECTSERDRIRRKVYNKTHPEVVRRIERERRRRIRRQILEKFGGKCNRCGFDDPRALQIDHVNGGGKKELKSITPFSYRKKVLNDTTGAYQLLCANCNWIKRHENEEF